MIYDHQTQPALGVKPSDAMNRNDPPPGNGEVIRRQIRTNVQQPAHMKAPIQQTWPSQFPQPTNPSNGFANHAIDMDNDTFRPISTTVDPAVALQSYSYTTAMAQRAGIMPHVNSNRLSTQPSLSQLQHLENTPPLERKDDNSTDKKSDQSNDVRRVYSGLAGTVAIGIGASIMAILSFQLLLGLNYYESPALSGVQLPEGSMPQVLRDISTALATVSLTCCLCSIMSSFLHFYLCTRVISQAQNYAECIKRTESYRGRTFYLSVLSNGGFFVGIIIFLSAMIAYQQLLSRAFGTVNSSTVATIIFGVGAFLCLITLLIGFCSVGLCQGLCQKKDKKESPDIDKRGTLV